MNSLYFLVGLTCLSLKVAGLFLGRESLLFSRHIQSEPCFPQFDQH